jgi:hypothetical protein
MICYLIPDCKTCVKQEKLLKETPNPSINVRYIPMSQAKKTKHTFPLWKRGKQIYEGIVRPSSFGLPTLSKVFRSRNLSNKGLCSMLERPAGPRDTYYQIWQGSKTMTNNRLNFPKDKLVNEFGKKSCFGSPMLLGGGNSIKEQKAIKSINQKVGQRLKSSAIKAGGKGSLTAAGISSLKSNKSIKITKDATGTTLTLKKK